jgi:hypothetical protein
LNPAGLRALSFWSGESYKTSRRPQHFGGFFESGLNGSSGAVFFLGISESRLNISTSALFFFVPTGLV